MRILFQTISAGQEGLPDRTPLFARQGYRLNVWSQGQQVCAAVYGALQGVPVLLQDAIPPEGRQHSNDGCVNESR